MNVRFRLGLALLSLVLIRPLRAAPAAPVTPDATPEARALLQLLYDVSGKYTFTGQHNFPNTHDHNSQFAAQWLGHTPVIFGTDMGFAKDGDSDSYLARPEIVQECIRQHRAGSIVALCWHAVPPTADEPVTFRPEPGADPKHLHSVQGQLTDEQFKELLTPGTALHRKWEQQVDGVAGFLKQLQDAHVPVLWRPYHEMNGDWFWWGGRGADTAAVYRMMYDRYTNVHHLKNLIWVWSMDRVSKPGMEHAKYFPGIQYVDVLALDVYGNDFAQSYYDSLEQLSQGKPLALAEVGNPPSPEILARQPKWTYYMTWSGMVRNTSRKAYATLFQDPRVVNRDDPSYAKLTADYRRACDLAPLSAAPRAADFTGHWVLNEDESQFGRTGASFAPAELDVTQAGDRLTVRSTRLPEWREAQTTTDEYTIGGGPTKSEFMHAPRTTSVQRQPDGGLAFDSTVSFPWGAPGATMQVKDAWQLEELGQKLVVTTDADTPRGKQQTRVVYDRR